MARTGGQVIVDQLAIHGAELAFGVPGESYLAVLDALLDSPVRYITCRHEAGAANMAAAYGKLTGRPGVCLVTRGPGATQASVGVHTAYQDAIPLVVLVGQVARDQMEREAFQEVEYRRMFGPLSKWVAQIDDARRVPELVARAFSTATSGRPGPVVLALPEDMLAEEADVPDASPFLPAQAAPSAAQADHTRELLEAARSPLVLVGGMPWSQGAADALGSWCARSGVPLATAWRCQDYVDNGLPCYAGHLGLGADPALTARLLESDLLLVVGARLGDVETRGYATLVPPNPGRTLVHVHPDPEEVGRVYQPTLGIVASGAAFAAALGALPPLAGAARRHLTDPAYAAFVANTKGREFSELVDPTAAIQALSRRLPDDAIVTNGAGNFAMWAHRFHTFRRYGTQLAPQSGAMGFGLPAAVAAKIMYPDKRVVCISGDGDFLMSVSELATAVQFNAPIVVLVLDNGMYGTIRMHQERLYPGRVSGTDLQNPDFAALARSFGCRGERVERTDDVASALERALASPIPTVLHLLVAPENITPRETITEIRAAARARLGA